MKRVIVFPGQGSQTAGMGKRVFDAFASARLVFEEADDVLGQKLSRLMFEGPEDELRLTHNAQPAIMVSSIAIMRVLESEFGWHSGRCAAYFAGHSLGEYTALCAAGSLSLADTARLLRLRGNAMQKAAPEGKGAMAALLGFNYEKASKIVEEASQFGVCVVANDNSPEQVVISGEKKVVQQASDMAINGGAKRAIMLQVSAPFHSPLMQPAAEAMKEALANISITAPTLPIISNVTASAAHSPDTIRELLVTQVCSMVRWRESVQYMAKQGATEAVELGTGKVLSGLIRRTESGIETLSVETPAEVEAFGKKL